MNATNVEFLRSNEINDVFSYIDIDNELEYVTFPRTMGMSIIDVENYLNP